MLENSRSKDTAERTVARYARQFKILAELIDEPDALAVALDLHREFGEMIAERAVELTDPTKPERERFSWRDIAAATGVSKSTLFDILGPNPRKGRGKNGRITPLGIKIATEEPEGPPTERDLAQVERTTAAAETKDRQAVTDRARREAGE